MVCKRITHPDGSVAILCTRGAGGRRQRCGRCGDPADYLCDAEVVKPGGTQGTCDAPLCRAHAYPAGPDQHRCWLHEREYQQAAQGGG